MHYDVIVIGGGPSGLMAAVVLQKKAQMSYFLIKEINLGVNLQFLVADAVT